VRVAGFTQGGGYGYTSRIYGLGCDQVLEATVMLADGGIAVASPRSNPDLYWALRGGSGGNFGVLLHVKYALHNPARMCGFRVWWKLGTAGDNDKAARVLDHMQAKHMRSDTRARKLGYQEFIAWQKIDDNRLNLDGWYLLIRGMYEGTQTDLEAVFLGEIRKFAPPTAELFRPDSTYREVDHFTHEDPAVPQVDDAAREDKQSLYIDQTVGVAGWKEIIERFITDNPNSGNLLGIEPYGGAIEAHDQTATAFIHRKADMDLYVDVFWMEQAKRAEAARWLTDFMRFLEDRKWTSGHSYQNYMREALSDYRHRYWGDSFFSLRAVKRKYDKKDFFWHPQGILASKDHPVYDDPPPGKLHPKVYDHLRPWLGEDIKYLVNP